jgi:prepilin-type processing-associated H-X9-DG protein
MAAVVLVLAVQLIVPHLSRTYDHPTRIYCASNMKQIGLGAIMYANTNHGHFPDDLDTLVETEDLEPRVLMCPMTAQDVPVAPTTREVVAAMRKADLISYIYVGKGLTTDASADTVVAYEKLTDHTDGMNVLFADGHIEYLEATEAKAVLNQTATGKLPIVYPVPTTQPSPTR